MCPMLCSRPPRGRPPRTPGTGPLTEAYWIRAALAAKASGAPAGAAAAVAAQHTADQDGETAADQDGEVARLVRVADACRTVTEARVRRLLPSAGVPAPSAQEQGKTARAA